MKVSVMTTNNGAHTADDWAKSSVELLLDGFVIRPESGRFAVLTAKKVAIGEQLLPLLQWAYLRVQQQERFFLAEGGVRPIDGPFDVDELFNFGDIIDRAFEKFCGLFRLSDTVELVSFLTGRTMTEASLDDYLYEIIRSRLYCDARTIMQIERKLHKHEIESRR